MIEYGAAPLDVTEPPKKRRTGLIISLAAVGVLVVGGAGVGIVALTYTVRKHIGVLAAQSPSPSPSPSPEPRTVNIDLRSADPASLTVAEVFPGRQLSYGNNRMTLLKKQRTSCPNASYGTLRRLWAKRGCSEVVRATGVDSSGRFVLTVGVANFPTAAAAASGAADLKSDSTGGVSPMTVPNSPAEDYNSHSARWVSWGTTGHFVVFADGAMIGHLDKVTDQAGLTLFEGDMLPALKAFSDRRQFPRD
jgi:hypothetical protein